MTMTTLGKQQEKLNQLAKKSSSKRKRWTKNLAMKLLED